MATNNAPTNVVQPQQPISGLKRFNSSISNIKTQDYLQSVLGEKKSSFINNVTALVANDSALQQCAPMTVIYAALKATALDLPLDKNLGYAYVIPYNNTKAGTSEASFQMGFKGYIQLALRSGQFLKINAREVYQGEIVREDYLSGDIQFKAIPASERKPENLIGFVAYFKLTNGFEKMLYMTKEECEAHAMRYSQTYKNARTRAYSKWATDFVPMSLKTVIKLLLSKYAPLSVEMQSAVKADQAILRENENDYNYDDSPNEAEQIEVAVVERKEEMRQASEEGDMPALELL